MPPKKNSNSGGDKPKKTLYHSELVQMGAVKVKILSEVKPSKYTDKPPYVEVEIDGAVRQYNCENDACAAEMDEKVGQVVILEASGSREEAEISIAAAAAGPPQEDPAEAPAPVNKPWKKAAATQTATAQTQTPAKTAAPTAQAQTQQAQTQTPEQRAAWEKMWARAKMRASQFNNAVRLGWNFAYMNAADLRLHGVDLEIEDLRTMATSIAMDLARENLVQYFPAKPLEFKMEPPKEKE